MKEEEFVSDNFIEECICSLKSAIITNDTSEFELCYLEPLLRDSEAMEIFKQNISDTDKDFFVKIKKNAKKPSDDEKKISSFRNTELNEYIKRIGSAIPLSTEREREILITISEGNKAIAELTEDSLTNLIPIERKKLLNEAIMKSKEASKVLYESNLRLVISLAMMVKDKEKNTNKNKGNLMDYIEEGNKGLGITIKNFNISFNNRFSTYAYYNILHKIQEISLSQNNIVNIPANIRQNKKIINSVSNILSESLKRSPTNEEIYQYIQVEGLIKNVTLEKINEWRDMQEASILYTSRVDQDIWDNSVAQYESSNSYNKMSQSNYDPESQYEKNEIKEKLDALLMGLEAKKRIYVTLRYQIHTKEEFSSFISSNLEQWFIENVTPKYGNKSITRKECKEIISNVLERYDKIVKQWPDALEKIITDYIISRKTYAETDELKIVLDALKFYVPQFIEDTKLTYEQIGKLYGVSKDKVRKAISSVERNWKSLGLAGFLKKSN
jgi:RNA polymerase sigma factor (sigma-70 family)